MKTKVTFSNRDEILGAIIRALAVQVAGFQVVGGMNKNYLNENGYYLFQFSDAQLSRFNNLIKEYVPERFHNTIQIGALNR